MVRFASNIPSIASQIIEERRSGKFVWTIALRYGLTVPQVCYLLGAGWGRTVHQSEHIRMREEWQKGWSTERIAADQGISPSAVRKILKREFGMSRQQDTQTRNIHIREDYKEGLVSYRDLAKKYHVSKSTVENAVKS